jgi:hypothetical protein
MRAEITFIIIAFGWFIFNWIVIRIMYKRKVKEINPTIMKLKGFKTYPYPF